MMNFIKKNRRFILTMAILVAIIAVLGLKLGQQTSNLEAQKENIVRLQEEVPRKKEEKNAALKAQKAAESDLKKADKAKKDAKKAADKLDKELKTVQQAAQQNETAQADSLTALKNVLAMLAQEEPVDQDLLMAELETALTALGGTMPGTETVEEGTEK